MIESQHTEFKRNWRDDYLKWIAGFANAEGGRLLLGIADDYPIPIQISVYPDKMMIWNSGSLPQSWTMAQLLAKHASKPFNHDIANVFFRAGLRERH